MKTLKRIGEIISKLLEPIFGDITPEEYAEINEQIKRKNKQ